MRLNQIQCGFEILYGFDIAILTTEIPGIFGYSWFDDGTIV
ncbi:hypothetical protein [Bradyrhizobium sp. UFLA05-112]